MTPKSTTTTHPQTSHSRAKDVTHPPQSQHSELLQILNILILAYHRNKNQHRRSRWWKELNLLRRNLRRLLAQPESQKGKEKEGFESRARFLRVWLLPRCWVAFSGLVGDNQYAALGLMLLGTLARLGRVLGLDLESQGAGGELDVGGEEGIEDEMVEMWQQSGRVNVDLGVLMAREEAVGGDEARSEEDQREHARSDREAAVVETEKVPVKKKRRKKHRDAIDELFSGLI